MRLLITNLLLLFCYFGFAQIAQLEDELFNKQQPYILKIDPAKVSCKNPDESILKDSVKYTVDVDAVLHILEKITFHEIDVDTDELENLYKRYAKRYDEVWGKVYLEKHCLFPVRSPDDESTKQFKVLAAFETTLKSLSFKQKRANEIWQQVLADYEFFQNLIFHKKDPTLLFNEAVTYSEIYKKLNRQQWYGSHFGFSYLDPYVDQIKEFFIDELGKCNCKTQNEEACNLAFLKQHQQYIAQIDDVRVPALFVEKKKCIIDDPGYIWLVVTYLEKNYAPDLLKITLRILFDAEPSGHVDFKILKILGNEENLAIYQEMTSQFQK